MNKYEKTIIPIIKSVYNNFTPLEKNIADFFIHNTDDLDLSSKHIASLLYVSEASLSRFAQKCGFKGYREFVFNYKESFLKNNKNITDLAKHVLNSYQELLNKSFELIDEKQMNRIVKMLTEKKRVFVYGMGSSGLAAHELQFRFMRLGLDIEAISDSHIIKMNSVLVNENCLVIAISVSGKTKEIISSLKIAKEHNASTILITANKTSDLVNTYDEVLLIGTIDNLDMGNAISPQFPILVMVDIFYAYFLNTDLYNKSEMFSNTLSVLYDKKDEWH